VDRCEAEEAIPRDLHELHASTLGRRPKCRVLRRLARHVGLGHRVHLCGVNRTFLTFGSMAAASALPEDELREVVDDWTVRGALRRGLVLKCGTCMYANWYSADEIGHSFRCPRCRDLCTRSEAELAPSASVTGCCPVYPQAQRQCSASSTARVAERQTRRT
jgi:hypothetical protein